MYTNSKVTVVIPTKEAGDKIEKCLEAIFEQTVAPYEVIVVDGHSKDNTVARAQKFNVKIVYEEYGTVGGARKIGVEKATGQYVAFTDSDCIPKKDWLENLINEFEGNIMGVGGATVNIGVGIWQKSISLAMDSFIGSGNSVQDRMLPTKRYVKSISGCNCIYRRADLLKVGNYNSSLRINEDTELNKRLQPIGNILYIPNALVYHNQDRGLKAFAKRMYRFGEGRAINKLMDIQVIPPILALINILFLFVSVKAFIFMLLLYLSILLVYDAMIYFKHTNLVYLLSVPIIFMLQHVFYTFGFWNGIIKNIVRGIL